MALIKYGGGIVQMSGSIAGNVFARNHYGNYARARTKPVNPNTAGQQVVRAAMALLTEWWSSSLTANQRTAWNLYGSNVAMTNKLGETVYLTGFNHYIRSNANLKRIVGTMMATGPVVFEIPEADPLFAITASEATQEITVTADATLPWALENGAYMFVFMGQPQNAQRNFFGGPWKYAGFYAGAVGAAPGFPLGLTPPYAIAEGQHLWCYARIIRADARLSQPFRADVLCAA